MAKGKEGKGLVGDQNEIRRNQKAKQKAKAQAKAQSSPKNVGETSGGVIAAAKQERRERERAAARREARIERSKENGAKLLEEVMQKGMIEIKHPGEHATDQELKRFQWDCNDVKYAAKASKHRFDWADLGKVFRIALAKKVVDENGTTQAVGKKKKKFKPRHAA